MANEITTVIELKALKTSLSIAMPRLTKLVDMAGTFFTAAVQSIGFAAHELLVLNADQVTVGYCCLVNTDITNFVEIGVDSGPGTFRPLIKLKAGQACLFPSTTVAIYAKADTAAVKLEFLILEL
jgi:hypothetical protein